MCGRGPILWVLLCVGTGCHLVFPYGVGDSGDDRKSDRRAIDDRGGDLLRREGSGAACELTEGSLGIKTEKICTTADCSTPATAPLCTSQTLAYEPGSGTKRGADTAKLVCNPMFNNCPNTSGVRFTRSTSWDLTSFSTIHFWVWANSYWVDADSPCGRTPWIRLVDVAGKAWRVERNPGTPTLPTGFGAWSVIDCPLKSSGTGWQVTPDPAFSWAQVKSVEIDFQPGKIAAGGYTIHIDDLTFTGGKTPFDQCP